MPVTQQAVWWQSNGLTFRSRIQFEQVVEKFAKHGGRDQLAAANTLMRNAMVQHKLSADQYTDIKERLHL